MQTFSSPGDKPKKSITHTLALSVSLCVRACVRVWANPDLKGLTPKTIMEAAALFSCL